MKEFITRNRNLINQILYLLCGTFLCAFTYNFYILPSNLVKGGIGGIAIVISNFVNIPATTIINIATILLALLSVAICGLRKTSHSIIGYTSYAIMVSLTAPLAKMINFQFDSILSSIVICSFLNGLGAGFIYYAGFNTGGVDSITMIVQKYVKVPAVQISLVINSIIIVVGLLVFGIEKTICAIIFLRLESMISSRIVLGKSTSKLCFIKTRNNSKVEEYLVNNFGVSFTTINSTNGIGFLKKDIIMCVIPSERIDTLKMKIKEVDKKCTFVATDCYTSYGGTINKLVSVEGI